jgi:drug/metabolite transporter (DMT)-like permease
MLLGMEKIKGHLYLMGGFALAGTSVVAARLLAGRLGTFSITALSLAFALLGLLPFCAARLRGTLAGLHARQWLLLGAQAGCGIFLFRMFLLQGMLRTSAGEAGILTGATPAITALLAALVLRERLGWRSLAGIALSVAGIVFLQGVAQSGAGFERSHLVGNLLVLCAAASESLFNTISRLGSLRQTEGKTLDVYSQTWLVALIALVLCLGPAVFEHPMEAAAHLELTQWLALGWYGLFVTALAFVLFYAGIRHCSAATAGVLSGMIPFTALILSVLLLREPAGWAQWLGGGLIVGGMALIGGQEAGRETRKEASVSGFEGLDVSAQQE